MAQATNLARAASLGGAGGLVIGGAVLFYVGFMRTIGVIDCAGLTAEECAFEHTAYKSIGQLQTVAGIALFLLGLALYVLWRRPRQAPELPNSEGEKP
jgi:hypothetical protein